MSAALHSWAEWSGQLGFLWEIGVKSTLILATAFVLHFLLKQRQAIVRAVVWNAALLALLILPNQKKLQLIFDETALGAILKITHSISSVIPNRFIVYF